MVTPGIPPHIHNRILRQIRNSENPVPAGILIRSIVREEDVPTRTVRRAVEKLVQAEEIAYATVHGRSCLIPAILRPVRVGRCFTLCPEGRSVPDSSRRISILLAPGLAFGQGDHATTRICLQALEDLLLVPSPFTASSAAPFSALDVGTGSGVLAVAVVKAGAGTCLALDTDPVAVAESRRNVDLNGLKKHITVSGREAAPGDGPVDLILANLRSSTLRSLAGLFSSNLAPGGHLIFSGMRPGEVPAVLGSYAVYGFSPLRQYHEKGWSGVILQRNTT